MSGDRLSLTHALEKKHLGKDRDGLKEDTKRPQDLEYRELEVEQQGKNGGASKHGIQAERIELNVMARTVLDLHEVEHVEAASNEEDLHHGQIHARRAEKIEIPRHEHDCIQQLRLERETWSAYTHPCMTCLW